jgi:hypothetical protein
LPLDSRTGASGCNGPTESLRHPVYEGEFRMAELATSTDAPARARGGDFWYAPCP